MVLAYLHDLRVLRRPQHRRRVCSPIGRRMGLPNGRRNDRPKGRPKGRPEGRPEGRPIDRQINRPKGRPKGRPIGRRIGRLKRLCFNLLTLTSFLGFADVLND